MARVLTGIRYQVSGVRRPAARKRPDTRHLTPDTSERSEQVYNAALKLFREKGYHATSMQDIAAAVGLYKGSLYHYIDGKEDLLARVFERAMDTLLADVERIAADTAGQPSAQLRQIIKAHVEAVANNLDALTVFLHEWRALASDSLSSVRVRRDRYTSLVSDIIARGVRAGEFHAPDVRITTLGLIGMCNWLCQWYRPSGRLSPADIATHFADLVLDGLTTTSSSPGVARPPSRPRNG